jgi:hypothetical protein
MPRGIEAWLEEQNWSIVTAIYLGLGTIAYLGVVVCITNLRTPVRYVLDSEYRADQAQTRRVRRLKVGDRVRSKNSDSMGTVTWVSPSGDTFSVLWSDTGITHAFWCSDVHTLDAI